MCPNCLICLILPKLKIHYKFWNLFTFYLVLRYLVYKISFLAKLGKLAREFRKNRNWYPFLSNVAFAFARWERTHSLKWSRMLLMCWLSLSLKALFLFLVYVDILSYKCDMNGDFTQNFNSPTSWAVMYVTSYDVLTQSVYFIPDPMSSRVNLSYPVND